jgi:hypothetical protein
MTVRVRREMTFCLSASPKTGFAIMARIVLGMGTSHSPLLTFDVDTWIEKAADDKRRRLNLSDGRYVSYEELRAEFGERFVTHATREHLEEQRQRCQKNLDHLADALAEAAPDVVVIVGDDQAELFSLSNMPAVSVFYGDKVITHPWGDGNDAMPDWKRAAAVGYGMDRAHTYRGCRDVALRVIESLIQSGCDVGAASEVTDPHRAGFGHAYGFIVERLFRGREYPLLPVLLNTYFLPNVPTAARCFDIGRMLRQALEHGGDERFAIVASGGLSHFVTDEGLDRGVLKAITGHDAQHLRSIRSNALRSGSSEILNWILAAGAFEHLPDCWFDYIPVYRTPAGSGIGMGFLVCRP